MANAQDLDTQILRAHADGNSTTLVDLYARAADAAEDVDAKAFFLTYAHVFALELGHSAQSRLLAELKALGRE